MKPTRLLPCLFASLFAGASAFGQGSLTPPGAPAPTMKSLDQIEARKPIAGGTTAVTISAPGSYYLTGNITIASGDAITISAQNVNLDLNGFTVATAATTPSGRAIVINDVRISVRNGNLYGVGYGGGGSYSGGGFVDGITSVNPTCEGITVRDVSISGCASYGIKLFGNGYAGSRIEHCFVDNVGIYGIGASIVQGCAVYNCNGTAISAIQVSDSSGYGQFNGIEAGTVTNCDARAGASGAGISGTTATNCRASAVGSNPGIRAVTAVGCYGSSDSGRGIDANTATACYGSSTSGIGLFALTATSCQGVSQSGIGLQVNTGAECSGTTTSGTFGAFGNVLNNCQGFCNSGTGTGLDVAFGGANCLGMSASGVGIYANGGLSTSYGQTGSVNYYGIYCTGTATSCRAYNSVSGGLSMTANIAIGCTTAGGTITGSKFLGTP